MEHLYLRVSNSVSLRNAHYFIQCRLNCASTGNLSSKGTTTYGYNDTTHDHAVTQVGSNTYGYDANGNMTTRTVGGQTYTLGYDAEGHLVSVSGATTATFVYDGDGQRVISTIGTTTTGFVGDHTEWVVGAANQPTRYYNAGGLRLATRAAGVMYYPLTDHLGSTTMTTDASGYSTAEIRYKAWGETRYTYGTQQTKHTYTGQYSNVSDFGLMYYNARWYDSALGRFTSADTIVPDPNNPTSYNRYSYVLNNPINLNDPSGRWSCSADEKGVDCYSWINEILEMLKNGGDVSRGAYIFFITYDNLIKELHHNNGVNIRLATDQGPFGFQSGSMLTLASFSLIPEIGQFIPTFTIGKDFWSKPPDANTVGSFAHEVAHLFQGFAVSLSIQAEIASYEVQYLVTEEQGGTDDEFLLKLNTLWVSKGSNSGNFTDEDIEKGRDIITGRSGDVFPYNIEVGRPVLTDFYRWWFGSGLDTVLNVPSVFQNFGSR